MFQYTPHLYTCIFFYIISIFFHIDYHCLLRKNNNNLLWRSMLMCKGYLSYLPTKKKQKVEKIIDKKSVFLFVYSKSRQVFFISFISKSFQRNSCTDRIKSTCFSAESCFLSIAFRWISVGKNQHISGILLISAGKVCKTAILLKSTGGQKVAEVAVQQSSSPSIWNREKSVLCRRSITNA